MPTITINLTAQQAQRLQDAITEMANLPSPATMVDVQLLIKSHLKLIVENSELRVATKQLLATPFDPEVL